MILRDIDVYPDLGEYPTALTSRFRYRSRCLCNFLRRTVLKKLKFRTANIQNICVVGMRSPPFACTVNSCGSLGVEVPWDESRYKRLKKPESLHEFFISMLGDGLSALRRRHRLPYDELREGMAAFRAGGYENAWRHKRRVFRREHFEACLDCTMLLDRFTLTLVVTRGGRTVFRRIILKTPPDELHYHHRFGDVVVVKKKLVVTPRYYWGRPLFALPIARLGTP